MTTAARLDYLDARIGTLENFRSMVEFQIMSLNDQVAALTEALKLDGGAKRRRQEEKARRLAYVIRYANATGREYTAEDVRNFDPARWEGFTGMANTRWPDDPINPPSDETKALVAAMFAEPPEAER